MRCIAGSRLGASVSMVLVNLSPILYRVGLSNTHITSTRLVFTLAGRLLAWLHQRWPWLMRHSSFRPMTIIGWLRRRSRRKHAEKIAAGKRRGRPAIPAHIVEAVIRIARECPRYGAAKVAGPLKGGELSYPISKESVRQILKTHGIKPRPKGKRQSPREAEPS